MFDEISTVIPGASNAAQVSANLQALKSPALTNEQMQRVKAIYDKNIKNAVHQSW